MDRPAGRADDYPDQHATGRAWHALPAAAALAALDVVESAGLTAAEAAARLQRDGRNALPAARAPQPVRIVLRQLRSPLVYVLLFAAALSLALGHLTDAGFIGFVLLANSLLGAWQEWNAEQQSRALQGMLHVRATVVRDGTTRELDAAELVRGDIVTLESGQFVPADLRLLDTRGLEVNESLLTGESLPVAKDAARMVDAAALPADRPNCAYAGTVVVRGRAHGVVVATGPGTEVGRLARVVTAT